MAYATWNFIVTDLSGVAVGEVINGTGRQVIRSLSSPSTASFTIGITNPLLKDLLTRDLNLKVYRNNKIVFHGPLLTTQLVAADATQTPTVACAASDPGFRFDRRLSGKSANGTLFNGTDRLTIAESLIATANSDGEMGIQTLGQTCGSTAVYIAGPYKKLSECLADMGSTLSGFDWRIDPIEYSAGKIGQFKAAAILGSQQTAAVFEYQGRGNMRVPDYQKGIVDLVNQVFSIPDDGTNSPLGIRSATDATSITARGLYEEVVDTSNITNAALRDAVLSDHILYRKKPRQVLTFSPDFNDYTGRVPEWGVDYFIGDSVRGRVLYNGIALIDGYVRLYKMQFDIDDSNRETLTPTMVSET